jgi:hypothetical protein
LSVIVDLSRRSHLLSDNESVSTKRSEVSPSKALGGKGANFAGMVFWPTALLADAESAVLLSGLSGHCTSTLERSRL